MNDMKADRRRAVLELLETLVRIGAPTGQEHARARFVASLLSDAGLGQPVMDDHANVWLRLGPQDQPAVMLDAHLDTVFPDLQVELQKQGDWWQALGISDNTIHVAMLMAWVQGRHAAGLPWPATIISFTTGEEGQGNLRGMQQVMRQLRRHIAQVIVLDCGIRTLIHQAVGSLRWNIQLATQGGHSWSDFGRTSALHAACHWIDRLNQLAPWQAEHTTWNIGHITGGQSINTIAPHVEFSLEVRSVDAGCLHDLGQRIEDDMHALAASQADMQVNVQRIGDRPAGFTPMDHPLIKAVRQTHEEMGLELRYAVGSTNANWPMHLGIPAVCIGLAQGRGGHTPQDSVDISIIPSGMAKLDRLFDRLHA